MTVPASPRAHITQELGLAVRREGDELHGVADLTSEMWAPGTEQVRLSILATWADTVAGLLAVAVLAPRVPTTIELDVHLYQPPPGAGRVHAVARTVKVGRVVVVSTVDFTDEDGEPIGVGAGSFMAAPDPSLRIPPEALRLDAVSRPTGRLQVPFAERARCERREPGVAALPRSDDGLNSSRTINGGLVALVTEEAALSLTPGASLASLALRYLRPARVGPVVASADVRGGLGRVEVRDAGNDDRLAVVATTRTFGSVGR